MDPRKPTPWQAVFAKLGMTQNALAVAMGNHRSKISVALKSEQGLISATDQVKLMQIARDRGVDLTPSDLLPEVPADG